MKITQIERKTITNEPSQMNPSPNTITFAVAIANLTRIPFRLANSIIKTLSLIKNYDVQQRVSISTHTVSSRLGVWRNADLGVVFPLSFS